MSNFVLVQNGVVVQADRTGGKPQGFIKAPEDVCPGYLFDGEAFTLPPPPVLTDAERRGAMPPITPRQLRLTLLSIGITEAQVDAALVNDPAGQIEWKYATYFKRTHPLVDGLGIGFSITPEQIDSLWGYAQDL